MPTEPSFYYVYLLRDCATGQHHYTGVTQNLQHRLVKHNTGQVPHTSKFAPWYIETAIAFRDKKKATPTNSTSNPAQGAPTLLNIFEKQNSVVLTCGCFEHTL